MHIVKSNPPKTNICLRVPTDLLDEVNDMLAAVRKIQTAKKTDLLTECIRRGMLQIEAEIKEIQQ